MKDCIYFEDLLSARLDGPLTEQEEAELQAHLASCGACRRYAEDLQALHTDLSALSAQPPEGFAAAVLAGCQDAPAPVKPQKTYRWASLAAAAVLVLALVGGVPMLFGSAEEMAEHAAPAQSAADSTAQEPTESAPSAGGTQESDTETARKEVNSQEDATADNQADSSNGTASSAPAEPLTQEQALDTLDRYLTGQNRAWKLTPAGLSTDGRCWLIQADPNTDAPPSLFSIDRLSGVIQELPGTEIVPFG